MRPYLTLAIYFISFYAFSQGQRLRVAGTVQADTLRANRIIRTGGLGTQILMADGSVVSPGTNITISNGTISSNLGNSIATTAFVQEGLNGKLNNNDTLKSVRLFGDQSIDGLKTFTHFGTRLGGIPFGTGAAVTYTNDEINNNAQNIAIGLNALVNSNNIALPTVKEIDNIAFGNNALQFLGTRGRTNRLASTFSGTSQRNVALGKDSQRELAFGSENTTIGFNTGNFVIGEGNTVIGANAMGASTTGLITTVVNGVTSVQTVTKTFSADSSSFNVAIGQEAMANSGIKGNFNVALGARAGTDNVGGNYNTVIGARQSVGTRGASNQLNIVGAIFGQGVGLGGVNPRIGILKRSPAYTLDIAGDLAFTGRLLVGSSPSSGNSGQVLTSTGSGAAPAWAALPIIKSLVVATTTTDSLSIRSSASADTLKLPLAATNVRAGLVTNTAQEFGGNKTFRGMQFRPTPNSGINWLSGATGTNFDWQMGPDVDTSGNSISGTRNFILKYISPSNANTTKSFRFLGNGDLEVPNSVISRGYLYTNQSLTALGNASIGNTLTVTGNISTSSRIIATGNVYGDSLIAQKSVIVSKNVRADSLFSNGLKSNSIKTKQIEISNTTNPAAIYMKGVYGTWVGVSLQRSEAEQWFIGMNNVQNHLLITPTSASNFIGVNTTSPSYRLDVTGSIRASGSVYSGSTILSSDIRLKRNIRPLNQAMQVIGRLKAVEYDKKETLDSKDYSQHEFGFVAQEVQKILPLLVTAGNDKDKLLHLNYSAFIPLLTKAVQEQEENIKENDQLIEKLLDRIESIEKKINR